MVNFLISVTRDLTKGLKEQRLLQLFFSQSLCVVAWTHRLEQSIMGIEKIRCPTQATSFQPISTS